MPARAQNGSGVGAPAEVLSWLTRGRALVLFGIVLTIRLWIAKGFGGNFDSHAFQTTAELTLSGRNVYSATTLYNYSPVWAGVVAVIWTLARSDFRAFVLLLGLLQTLSDSASTVILMLIARRLGRSAPECRWASLLFFANPISVLASSAHGQFDGLAVLPLLMAILVALDHDGEMRHRGWIVGLLSASLLIKHVTIFQPLTFAGRARGRGLPGSMVAIPAIVLVASFVPFASAWRAIWANVVVYATHGAQPGGLASFLNVPEQWRIGFSLLLVAAALVAARTGRALELPRSSLILWLSTLTFLPSFGLQYLVWPLAVGCLYPSIGLGFFSAAGALFYSASGSSLGLAWPVRISEMGVWAAVAFWLASEASRVRAETATIQPWVSRP
jgi:hypothetical protein